MPVSQGSVVQASFYNSVQTTINGLLGTAYNQTVTSTQVVAGNTITAANWTALQNDINKCQLHQSGSTYPDSQLPALTGKTILAADVNLYETNANILLANKFNAYATNMTLTSNALTVTRSSAWGTSATPSITTEIQADWGTVVAMNAFFNTGGELRWIAAHPSTATSQDTSWNTLLSGLGPFNIHGNANQTSTATTAQVPLSFLTSSYQTIFTKNSTSTSYTANSITIKVKLNAGSTGIVIQITLTDAHTNANYDSVASGTNAIVSFLKSTVVMTGIVSPTVTTITPF